MKKILLTLSLALALGASAQRNVYGFSARSDEGKEISLSQYKGQVMLIVNTATKCGFTPQYKELQAIYEKFKNQGFVVLDFPCNQFGQQAPGSIGEIKKFCTENFETTFPLFQKIIVNGTDETPLFTYLKKKQKFRGFDMNSKLGPVLDQMMRKNDPDYDKKSDIKWNFTKFLVNRKGRVVKRFEPTESMEKLEEYIASIL